MEICDIYVLYQLIPNYLMHRLSILLPGYLHQMVTQHVLCKYEGKKVFTEKHFCVTILDLKNNIKYRSNDGVDSTRGNPFLNYHLI